MSLEETLNGEAITGRQAMFISAAWLAIVLAAAFLLVWSLP